MRLRKRVITNLFITDRDIKKITNGYVVYKVANGHVHCMIPKVTIDREKANKQRQVIRDKIDRLQKRLTAIGYKKVVDMSHVTLADSEPTKRRYTKHNKAFWAAGGNLKNIIAHQKVKHAMPNAGISR